MSEQSKLPRALAEKFGHVADCRDGKITGWRHDTLPEPDESEFPAIIAEYEAGQPARDAAVALDSTDGDFVRVIEDLIDTLIAQGVITEIELPQAAQDKLAARRNLRSQL